MHIATLLASIFGDLLEASHTPNTLGLGIFRMGRQAFLPQTGPKFRFEGLIQNIFSKLAQMRSIRKTQTLGRL
ncbi:hypothetical protein PM082_017082 [Marasmius tenuissimus]|nr:hypothetical protein PM082_017082 [Marasmius tenuissimus]